METDQRPKGLVVDALTITDVESNRNLVDGISFTVLPGETVALVGESGSGKSLTAKAIAGLLPRGIRASGRADWTGSNVISASETEMKRIRGTQISLLLQDPFTMLNPLSKIAKVLAETVRPSGEERDIAAAIRSRILEVGIDPDRVLQRYPWELSGGMRQRIGLAASISRFPHLLIADEPTTALDATTQREVLRLIRRLQGTRGMSLILITHDLRIAMTLADRVLVMSQGRIVESGTPDQLLDSAREPYTQRLLAAELPVDRRLSTLSLDKRLELGAKEQTAVEPSRGGPALLTVRSLTKTFTSGETALGGVSFEIAEGTSLGVIGESGSGKTTLARCLLGLERPSSGDILRLFGAGGRRMEQREIQCVFQDPYSSLNPSHSIEFTLMESTRHRAHRGDGDRGEEIAAALERVGLDRKIASRRPASLSGGQRQRVAIARALLMRPRLLVCDEPVAALDLSIQSQVLQVLRDAQVGGLTMVFITHDLSVARQMTDELVVLLKGKVVESGPTDQVLSEPQHDYTRHLLASVPTAEKAWLEI